MFQVRRFWLDAGSTGGDAGGAGANTGTPPASGGGQQGAGAETRFTQAELDRIIGECLARAEAAATEKLLKSLGVDKIDDAAAALKKQREADESAKTELQKAMDAKVKAEKDAADAKDALETAQKARITDRRNAKIEAAAAAAGAIDASDVLTWAERGAGDALTKVVKEDGAVDEAAIKKLIEAAQKEKPHFFKQTLLSGALRRTPGSPSNQGGSPSTPGETERKAAARAQEDTIRRAF